MTENKKFIKIVFFLSVFLIISIGLYLFFWFIKLDYSISSSVFKRILSSKFVKLVAMIFSALMIAVVSLVFQTITSNRILTPSMLGFDSVFSTTQMILIFIANFLNSAFSMLAIENQTINFIISTVVMVVVSFFLYGSILRKNKNNILLLLLAGTVISQFLNNLNNFFHYTISAEDAAAYLKNTITNIDKVNSQLLIIVLPIFLIIALLIYLDSNSYDVMSLGEDQAINLGINYQSKVKKSLILIAVGMAVVTALIGPISFLGLIAVNAAREMLSTYKHKKLIIVSFLMAALILILGQLVVEQLKYAATLSVVINIVGGIYVLRLILRGNKL